MNILKDLLPVLITIVPSLIFPQKKEALRDALRARSGRLFTKMMKAHIAADKLEADLNADIIARVNGINK